MHVMECASKAGQDLAVGIFSESRMRLKQSVGYNCGYSNRERSLRCLRCVRNFGIARLFRRLCAASHWLKDLTVLSDVMNLIASMFWDVFAAFAKEQGFINVRQKKCFGWVPQLPPDPCILVVRDLIYPYDGSDSELEWECAAIEAGTKSSKRKR